MSDLPRDWRVRRKRVLERDEKTCQIGGARCTYLASEVDHIVPRSEGGSHDDDNLRAVCESCHRERNNASTALKTIPLTRQWLPQKEVV